MSDLPSPPPSALTIQGLSKIYPASRRTGAKEALKGVDLTVPRGCLMALLGPNGAGKSTLINILAGLTLKTEGHVTVWDADIDAEPCRARALIGVVPQELNLDPFFTARELLEQQAGFQGVKPKERITEHLLETLSLDDVADRPCRALSGGMRRRLMVAKAMAHRPAILVLDEPTAGVDVELRLTLWEQIRKLQETGTTILLTTHYLEEAESLCERIAILNDGDIVANDTKENLLARLDKKGVTLTVDRDLREIPPNLRPHGWSLEAPRQLALTRPPKEMSLGQMLLAVQVNGLNIVDIVTREPKLEDIFLQLTGRSA